METVFFYAEMFLAHIENCGIEFPEDLYDFNHDRYLKWLIFCNMHLGEPIIIESLARNAEIIASLSDEKLRTVTHNELLDMGVVLGTGENLI